jgi:hypothetical protein
MVVLVVVVEMVQPKVVVVLGTGVVIVLIIMLVPVHLVAPLEIMEVVHLLARTPATMDLLSLP